jgi:hypothetical protein
MNTREAQVVFTTLSRLSSTAKYLVFTAFLFGNISILSAQTSPTCDPPCRSGYICKDSTCIQACNPPCPENYKCEGSIPECIPQSSQVQPVPVQAVQRRSDGKCDSQNDCVGNEICFDGECEEKEHVASTGNVFFGMATVFYGLGTLYCSVAPIIVANVAYNEPYHSSSSSYYSSGGYDEEAFLSTGPQISAIFLFGLLDKIPTQKQARNLRMLHQTPSYGLIASEWVLWGFSLVTAGLTCASYASDSRDEATTFAVVNCAVGLTAYVMNIVCYAHQRGKLNNAVEKVKGINSLLNDHKWELAPYAGYSKKTVVAGLALLF